MSDKKCPCHQCNPTNPIAPLKLIKGIAKLDSADIEYHCRICDVVLVDRQCPRCGVMLHGNEKVQIFVTKNSKNSKNGDDGRCNCA